MKMPLLAIAVIILGLAAEHAMAQEADVAEVPLAAAPAQEGYGPQIGFVAGVETPNAATAPAATAVASPPSDADAPLDDAAPVPSTPWHLPEPESLKELGIEQYGWLEQGVTFNSLSPGNRWNGPVICNDRSNDYEMNQLWLGWERKVKTDGYGWDIGGRIDIAYASDWRYGDCFGLETNIDAQNQLYGFVMPQFYLEAGYNDLIVKIGHYAACMGYEVVAAPGNFFYSHSYALGYSEPVIVTGPFGDGTQSSQFLFAADLIFSF